MLVLDGSNNPVEGLTTSVSDEKGKFYNLPDISPLPGYYLVMSDKYVGDFSTWKRRFFLREIRTAGR